MKQKLFTRNFTLLILGQISSLIGNFSLKFALSMYILEQTGSASVFAGLLAISMLPTVLLSPLGGILADRANRRNIMVTLDLLSGISVLAASFAVPSKHDIIVIGILLILLSVLGAFESPTVQACIPQMLSGDNILKGNAIVSQVASIASLITPFLGSIFYTVLGIRPIFYTAAVCFFITAFLECFIQIDYKKSRLNAKIAVIMKEDFFASMSFLRDKQPCILKLLLLAATVSLFVSGTVVIGFPYLVRTVLGLSANHYGIAESVMGIASVLGSLMVVLLAQKLRTVVIGFPYLVRTVLGLSANHYGIAESVMGIASVLGSLMVVLLAQKLRNRHLSIVLVLFGICLVPCGTAFTLPFEALHRYLILLIMFCACQLGCSLFSTYAVSLIQKKTPEHI